MKKKFMVALAGLIGLSCLMSATACGGGQGSSAGLPTPTLTVTEKAEHKIANGLHKINVSASEIDFANNGKSDYKIVIAENAALQISQWATLLRKHVRAATDADLSVVSDVSEWTADKKYIVIDCPNLFQQANLSMPEEDIGETGYYIKSAGNSVFIAANASYGIRNGVLEFLKHTVGYEMYAEDTVVYNEAKNVKLPVFDVIDKPDFEFFLANNKLSAYATTGMRFMNTSDIFIPVGGAYWHNSFGYLNPDDYPEEYFSPDKTQLCYTARGGQYMDEMVADFMQPMIAAVDEYPNVKNITITVQDIFTACTCDGCTAEKEKYGVDSAAVVKFCNRISDELDAYFTQKAEQNGTPKRTVNILFFAYFKMLEAPVKLVDGKYQPIDEDVVCRDNVGVYIAPINAIYNKSFYDEANSVTAEIIKGWGACSKKLYMWLYDTNFRNYLYPLNSYDTILETYRFCKENNALFLYPEGQWNQNSVTCFGKLKEYFNSKVLWNVNEDFSKICDNFFPAYFGPAAPAMRKYFNELQVRLRYIEAQYPEIGGSIYDPIAQARFWPKRLLEQWNSYMQEGRAAIESLKTSSPAMYEKYENHIKLESIFTNYALCTLHAGSYSAETLKAMRDSFKLDCSALKVNMVNEAENLETIFGAWNL